MGGGGGVGWVRAENTMACRDEKRDFALICKSHLSVT